jgi:hypothetical protein
MLNGHLRNGNRGSVVVEGCAEGKAGDEGRKYWRKGFAKLASQVEYHSSTGLTSGPELHGRTAQDGATVVFSLLWYVDLFTCSAIIAIIVIIVIFFCYCCYCCYNCYSCNDCYHRSEMAIATALAIAWLGWIVSHGTPFPPIFPLRVRFPVGLPSKVVSCYRLCGYLMCARWRFYPARGSYSTSQTAILRPLPVVLPLGLE